MQGERIRGRQIMASIRSRNVNEVPRFAARVIPWLGLAIAFLGGPVRGGEDMPPRNPAAVEYFEKTIRPILATRCLSCHDAARHKGGLRLDSRAGAMAGGTSGPAVVPGKPEDSLLVDAINYGETYQMPPKSKLPASEVAVLTDWVKRGAPWGHDSGPVRSAAASGDRLNAEEFQARARFWSFQPVKRVQPPVTSRDSWARNPIDRFLLHALGTRNLAPAPEADRRTLIRRVTFDLIGLPPTPEEVAAFLADTRPDAYEQLIERLLASPHFGARQARHWLDLVRYAETAGHEFDYDIADAYRYRDYVTRALNLDIPYDRFVVEHLAGDLIATPRRRQGDGANESILATGFLYLGEGTHSPVDVREEEMRKIDNQIDVISKAFLGLTLACARCHDHKFDPITTRDYYALAGFLHGTRIQHAVIDAPEARAPAIRRAGQANHAAAALALADRTLLSGSLRQKLDAIAAPAKPGSTTNPTADAVLLDDFSRPTLDGWYRNGDAFCERTTRAGDLRLDWHGDTPVLAAVLPGTVQSNLVSNRLAGVIRSATFSIRARFLHVRARGQGGRIAVVIDNFEKIRDPIYGGLTRRIQHDDWRVETFDLDMWRGETAFLELSDGAVADFGNTTAPLDDANGYLAVDWIAASDRSPVSIQADPVEPSVDLNAVAAALAPVAPDRAKRLRERLADARLADQAIQPPRFALAAADGTPADEHVHIRGSHKNLGELVPRRFLQVLGGATEPTHEGAESRLDLAMRMVDPGTNPLLARVIANRLWRHHFGEGLVATPDDFGKMGRPPSHPELLDWLASELVASGWSLKHLHRLMVASSAYRMSSALDPGAESRDPGNVLLHRMNPRRLEAEAIRDAVLAVSGRLNTRMEGPSVHTHLDAFMEGRGRPAVSGPLDGAGRRTLYLNVRRNFLNPFLLAFDMPVPFAPMGKRNRSNVPAQALALLNDPFIKEQAGIWAMRTLSAPAASDRARLDRAYETAFARLPSEAEAALALGYLDARMGSNPTQAQAAWTDLCHALLNTKEFLFVP